MRSATRRGRWPAVLVCATCALGACATGDGKTLRDPTGTLPPPTVPPAPTEPVRDGVGTLASLPLESLDPVELPAPTGSFTLFAPWLDGDPVEAINTCDAANLSPALSWTEPPEGTVELAVALVDESINSEAPVIHWVMAGINPTEISLIEGDSPLGAIRGLNVFGNIGYDGPCPPPGDPAHIYRLTIYALNQQVELADGTPAADLLDFVQIVTIASSDVTGTFAR